MMIRHMEQRGKKLLGTLRFAALIALVCLALCFCFGSAAFAVSVREPKFSLPGGAYTSPQTLTISCYRGWEIYYTTDGSDPFLYGQDPVGICGGDSVTLTISNDCTIKAAAYNSELHPDDRLGKVVSQTYYITGPEAVYDGVILFSRKSGTYDDAIELTLYGPAGYKVCYTTDGSSPVGSSRYSGYPWPNGSGHDNPVTLTVSKSCTVRATAYRESSSVYSFRGTGQQTYNITSSGVLIDRGIAFSPGGGTYDDAIELTISGPAGWNVCYTTDGSDPIDRMTPARPSPRGFENRTLTVSKSCIIRAVAYQHLLGEGGRYIFGDIAEQRYNITSSGVILDGVIAFSHGGGTYEGAQELTLSGPAGWNICYTIDGSSPIHGQNNPHPSPGGLGKNNPVTLTVPYSCTVKAVAYQRPLGGNGWYVFSEIAEQKFRIAGSSMITFSPEGGSYEEAQELTLSAPAGYKICYTTDGSSPIKGQFGPNPMPGGLGKSNPETLTVSESCFISAVAYKIIPGELAIQFGDIETRRYMIASPGDTVDGVIAFSPGGGAYEAAQELTLSCPADWKISYTTDGSDPIAGRDTEDPSPVGLGKSNPVTFTVAESCIVKAVAYQRVPVPGASDYYQFSSIAKQTYMIASSGVIMDGMIAFSPGGGTYEAAQELTLAAPVGWEISYTTDGSSPVDQNTSDPIPHGLGKINPVTFTVSDSCTVKAVAYQQGHGGDYQFGDIAEQAYVIDKHSAASPVFTPSEGVYEQAQLVSLSCETEGAGIHYTTDATNPTAESALYTGPLSVSESTVIKAIAVKAGMEDSAVADAAYLIGPTFSVGENAISVTAADQPAYGFFAPAEDGDYRFWPTDIDETRLYLEVLDGSGERVAEGVGLFDCVVGLEGGRLYVLRLWSPDGPAALKLNAAAVEAYTVTVDNDNSCGFLWVSRDVAYEGQYVYCYPFERLDDNGEVIDSVFLGMTVTDADGNEIPANTGFTMPASDVTIRPLFAPLIPITVELGEHVELGMGQTESHAFAADTASALEGETVELWPSVYDMESGEPVSLVVTVTSEDGKDVPCAHVQEEGDELGYYTFTMQGVPVLVQMNLAREYPPFGTAELVLPTDTLTVAESAFEGDTSITSVIIPAGCGSLGKWAFKNCENLSKIRIPQNCAIGEDAFLGCGEVYIYGVFASPADIYCRTHANCTFVAE